jgi:murein DD-endopeptidase MepM/ murein hydrolase activator NlpD
LLNFHMSTLAPGKEAYRGQSYGVDFIAHWRGGFRTSDERWMEPLPSAPSAYRIFGAPIHAPCGGRVAAAVDGLTDQPAGMADRRHMAGNHVILQCEGYEVLLAHIRQGSVRVAAGDAVEVGTLLGEVGNTGNSDEPHLHISVQRPAGESLGGEPIHVTFEGRYLARHACLPPLQATWTKDGRTAPTHRARPPKRSSVNLNKLAGGDPGSRRPGAP